MATLSRWRSNADEFQGQSQIAEAAILSQLSEVPDEVLVVKDLDSNLLKLYNSLILEDDDNENTLNCIKQNAVQMVDDLYKKYSIVLKTSCLKKKILLLGMKILPDGIICVSTSDEVKSVKSMKKFGEYEGLFCSPKQVKENYYGCDAISLCTLTEDIKYVVFLSSLFEVQNNNTRPFLTKISSVLNDIQRCIHHQKQSLMHYATSTIFSKLLTENYEAFSRSKSKYLNLDNDSNDNTFFDEDTSSDEDVEDATMYQNQVVPFQVVDEVEKNFQYLLKKPVKISGFKIGMEILLNATNRLKLRREGSQLRQRKLIYRHYLDYNEDNQLKCKHCNCSEAHHPIKIVSLRKDHAFRPKVVVECGKDKDVNTFAWVKLEETTSLGRKCANSEISSFVNFIINTQHPMYDLCSRYKDALTKELTNVVNEIRLPVIDRKRSETLYGPVNAFQNGIFVCKTCHFYTYDEFCELHDLHNIFPHIITHYSDEWFFYEQYMSQLKGKKISSETKRPKKFCFENYVPNLICTKCGLHQFCHKRHCKNPEFKILQCDTCHKFCRYDSTSLHGVVAYEDDERFPPCSCFEMNDIPQCFSIDVPKAISNIKTPFLDCVLDNQFDNEDHPDYKSYLGIYFWLFVCGGYFILPLSQGSWEIIPAIFGEAGSGKSLFLSALTSLVPPDKVGCLSSNAQATFGLENLISENGLQRKYAVYETSGSFKIPCQQFQSMASRESISINRKNKVSFITTWYESGFFIGNIKPHWSDTNGALRRRLIQFQFKKKVHETDAKLKQRIRTAALLFKSCIAYKFASKFFGSANLLDVNKFSHRDMNHHVGKKLLPPSLILWNQQLLDELSPLTNLLNNPMQMMKDRSTPMPCFIDRRRLLSPNQKVYTRLLDIKDAFNMFKRGSNKWKNSANVDFEPDLYTSIFKNFGLEIRKCLKEYPPGSGQQCEYNYVFGIGKTLEWPDAYRENQLITHEANQSESQVEIELSPEQIIYNYFDNFVEQIKETDGTNFESKIKVLTKNVTDFKGQILLRIKHLKNQASLVNISQEHIKDGIFQLANYDNDKCIGFLIDLLNQVYETRNSSIGSTLSERMHDLYNNHKHFKRMYCNQLEDSDMDVSEEETEEIEDL